MKNVIVGFALGFIALSPLAASATLIQVNYAGTVWFIAGTGLGYAINDSISGTMSIDTNLGTSTAEGTAANSDYQYYRSSNPQFVVGGQVGPGDDYAHVLDEVIVQNRIGAGGFDLFNVYSGSDQDVPSYSVFYQSVYVADGALDFVTGTGLDQSFALTSSDIGGLMNGFVATRRNFALFNLSSISVRPVAEPGALSLLGAGLLGLMFLRRRGIA